MHGRSWPAADPDSPAITERRSGEDSQHRAGGVVQELKKRNLALCNLHSIAAASLWWPQPDPAVAMAHARERDLRLRPSVPGRGPKPVVLAWLPRLRAGRGGAGTSFLSHGTGCARTDGDRTLDDGNGSRVGWGGVGRTGRLGGRRGRSRSVGRRWCADLLLLAAPKRMSIHHAETSVSFGCVLFI